MFVSVFVPLDDASYGTTFEAQASQFAVFLTPELPRVRVCRKPMGAGSKRPHAFTMGETTEERPSVAMWTVHMPAVIEQLLANGGQAGAPDISGRSAFVAARDSDVRPEFSLLLEASKQPPGQIVFR